LLGKSLAHVEADAVGSLVHAATFIVLGLEKYFEKVLSIDFWNSYPRILNYYLDADMLALVPHRKLFYSNCDSGVVLTELDW